MKKSACVCLGVCVCVRERERERERRMSQDYVNEGLDQGLNEFL